MKLWKTLARRVLCTPNRFLTVEMHDLELPDGRRINDWPWLVTPDYVNVVAVTAEGRFICFRQTKYAVDGTTLAPVGGFIEPGENPLDAGKRELLEESGFVAGEWHSLGSFPVDANRGAGTAHFYLALGATRDRDPVDGDLEEQHLVLLQRTEVEEALAVGEFKVLGWVAAVALALRHLDKKAAPAHHHGTCQ